MKTHSFYVFIYMSVNTLISRYERSACDGMTFPQTLSVRLEAAEEEMSSDSRN